MTINNDNHLPPDLAPIAGAVDDLALRERRSAAPTLEDRIFMATRAGLAADAAGNAPIQIVVRRRGPWLSRVKLAAALALCAGGLAIWMAQLNPSTPPASGGLAQTPRRSIDLAGLEADVELLLTIRTFADGFDEIDDLYLDAEEVLSDDWLKTVLDEGVL